MKQFLDEVWKIIVMNDLGNKRILIIMPEYVFGGAEVQLRYIIHRLERENRQTDVLVLHQFVRKNGDTSDSCLLDNGAIRFFDLDLYHASEEEIKWGINMFICNREADGEKYYVSIQFHEWTTVVIPILQHYGIKTIYSERVSGIQVIKNEKFLKSIMLCDLITCNSITAKKRLEEKLKRNVRLILNGKPKVERFEYERRKPVKKILIPANIDPRKNQLIIIDFLDKYSDDDYSVRFVGKTNSAEYLCRLKTMVDEKDLSEKVIFVGAVENMEVEYKNTDIVVLPSLAEGTPNVVLEAFAYGIPVVVSDIEEERELVKDRKFRFDPASVDELYSAIKNVEDLSDSELENILRDNSEFVRKNYGIRRMTDEFLELLDEAKRINSVDYDYEISEDVYRDISIMGNDLRKSREFYSILCDIVDFLQNGIGLRGYFESHGYKKISIYGFKELGQILKNELDRNNIEICDIIDRDTTLGPPDIQIVPPDNAGKADVIVVTAIHYYTDIAEEMRKKTGSDIVSLKDVVTEVKERINIEKNSFNE